MHTYQRKGKAEKVYVKPQPVVVKEPGTKVQQWFESRGISLQTLNDLKVTEGSEWMPQTGKPRECNKVQLFYGR